MATKKDEKNKPSDELTAGKRLTRKQVKEGLNAMHERSVNAREARAAYTKRKAHVALMEELNDDKIIVFESIDAPWHKIGWKSALIYAYDVAERVCQKKELPTIRRDTDHNLRSDDGIVFVRSMENFIARMEKAGIKYEYLDDGIYVFQLEKKYNKQDIKGLRNIKYSTGDELFAMTVPKKVYPELRGLIVKAEKTVLPKCKKMPGFYREMLGSKMADSIMEMNYCYFDMANGRGDKQKYLIKIVEEANAVLAILTLIQELEIWNPIEIVASGSVMIDIKMSVKRIVNRAKNREEDEEEVGKTK